MIKNETLTQIRWLIRRDMPYVLAIEQRCFEISWTEDDFLCCLRQRSCIGKVALDDRGEAIGYMLYELHHGRIELINFAVDPEYQRLGVGRQMAEHLKTKIREQRRDRLTVSVRETNLNAQLFFRSMGFVAKSLEDGCYDDTDESSIKFIYRAGWD